MAGKKVAKRGPKAGRQSKKAAAPAKAKGAAVAADKAPKVETRKLTPGNTLTGLLRECRGLAAESASINGSLREKIAYAKEHKHLNPPAFAMLRRFDKMEAEKASILYYDFMAYMESSGVLEKIESVGRLPLEGEAHAAPAKDETGGARKPRAAAAKQNGSTEPEKQNGEAAEPNPAVGAQNVTRPQFGQRVTPTQEPPGGGGKVQLVN